MAGIIRGSVGGACINSFTFVLDQWINDRWTLSTTLTQQGSDRRGWGADRGGVGAVPWVVKSRLYPSKQEGIERTRRLQTQHLHPLSPSPL